MASIYWFSGTGNSYHAARAIGTSIGDTRLVRITDRLCQQALPIEDDVVGFVFPVYAAGMPVMVAELLKKVGTLSSDYLFAVATHAGAYGNALRQFEGLAGKAGGQPDALFDLRMPANTRLSEAPSPPDQKTQNRLRESDEALSRISAMVVERSTLTKGRGGGLYGLAGRLFHAIFCRGIGNADKGFTVTGDCTSCGVCVRVCPAGDITLDESGRPEWHHRCEGCMACISWCPEHAIARGGKGRKRYGYRHPDVSAGYLMRSG